MQTQYFQTRTEFFEFGYPVEQDTQWDHHQMGAWKARRVCNMSHKGYTLQRLTKSPGETTINNDHKRTRKKNGEGGFRW